MSGKTVIVTGANSGIGKATAMALAQMGTHVVMVCRDRVRGEQAQQDINAQASGGVELLIADLASQQQIRRIAAEFLSKGRSLHALVNNAGVTLNERSETEDGIETTFAINHLAPFLLTSLLLDVLQQSAPSRVVTVSSAAHLFGTIDFNDINSQHGYGGLRVYGASKLANILFTTELARRMERTGVTANSLHPGSVATNFGRNNGGPLRMMVKMMAPLMRSPARGAETSIYLAASPDVEGVTGRYFFNSREKRPSKAARDERDAGRLWRISEEMTRTLD